MEDPKSVEYKVESFGCTFATKKKFSAQLQDVINTNAALGWEFHSFTVIIGDTCVVIFRRNKAN